MLPDGARGPLQHAVLRGLLNGWQLSGISTVVSGEPIWLGLSGQARTYGIIPGLLRHAGHMGPLGPILSPVYTCDPRLGGTKVGEKVLDLSCIQVPALGQEGQPLPPYNIRRPLRQDHDLTVFKNFALRGSQKLQLRFGFFDLFNTAYANDIDTTLDTDCNQYVDHVPNGVGGYVDHVCDPSGRHVLHGPDEGQFRHHHLKDRPPGDRARAEVLLLILLAARLRRDGRPARSTYFSTDLSGRCFRQFGHERGTVGRLEVRRMRPRELAGVSQR